MFNIKQTKNLIDGTVLKFLGSTISINHKPHTWRQVHALLR